jgi:DNA-binding transcriptional MerR regulator
MRISELCEVSGVSMPSIKYYLREGLLQPGERTSATQADYGPVHVARLRLIKALLEVGGLSVATANRVLAAVDTPDLPLSYTFGVAQYAVSDTGLFDPVDPQSPGLAMVEQLLEKRGWKVSADNPGRSGAARVLDTYASLGRDHLAEITDEYAEAAELIARSDLAAVGRGASVADMAETVVVGTVLGDQLVASLRRMAQEHISFQLFPAPRSES